MTHSIKVAVAGATGHTGCELIRLLHGHPQVELVVATSQSQAKKTWAEAVPELAPYFKGRLETYDVAIFKQREIQAVFLCLPNGEAAKWAPALLEAGLRVIDLSADFRFSDIKIYEKYYGKHSSPQLLSEAAYGLPELGRERISQARLVANPGCYVTAATLALKPLVDAGLIDTESVIIDAASGVSGAGRALKEHTQAIHVQENYSAYGVLEHRHQPEIENNLGIPVVFTPHLLPVNRGILATCYARIKKDVDTQDSVSLSKLYESAYAREPFVDFRLAPFLPSLHDVVYTNRVAIALRYDPARRQVIVLSAIDNLVKGASGQAIQNLNVMFGLSETAGLNL